MEWSSRSKEQLADGKKVPTQMSDRECIITIQPRYG